LVLRDFFRTGGQPQRAERSLILVTYHLFIAAVFVTLIAGVSAMAVQYLLYRRKVTPGRDWHPERRVRKPFWL
jgi:multisubunit Na+/H+ antiporter MnhG subunit